MAAVLVLLASGLAACGDDDSDAGPPEPRPTPTPTASQASESTPAADPTDGVGPRRGALRYADILVFSKDTLTDDMVDRIRGLDGVRSVERLSMAQVSIENRAINLAAVDPATYRNYTPAESAELQEEWDRVAAGQLALVPDLKKRVPGKKGSLRLGSGRDAPTVAIGAYAPQIPRVDAVVNADVGEALGMKPDNALLVATYPRRAPQSVRKPVERIAGDQASVQLLGPDLDISVQQTAYLVGSVGRGRRHLQLHRAARRPPHRAGAVVGRAPTSAPGRSRSWVRSPATTRSSPSSRRRSARSSSAGWPTRSTPTSTPAATTRGSSPAPPSSPTTPSAWRSTSTCPATSAAPSARWTAPSSSIFESWGFTWGGHWRYTDPMHFEANAIVNPG